MDMVQTPRGRGRQPRGQRIDADALREALRPRLLSILRDILPAGKVRGNEFVVGNIQGEPGDSLSFNFIKGVGGDFAGGGATDIIGLYAAVRGLDFPAAIAELNDRYGSGDTAPPPPPPPEPRSGAAPPPIVPIPDTAPPPPTHIRRAPVVALWTYRDAQGAPLFHVARTETGSDRGKSYAPLYWSARGWFSAGFPKPRPLYGLHLLNRFSDAIVIVVEGEKCADKINELGGDDLIAVTWPGGSAGVGSADWSPLYNRDVVIWPDNDPAGYRAADNIEEHIGGEPRRIMVPSSAPAKWDAADAIDQDGWSVEDILRHIQARPDAIPSLPPPDIPPPDLDRDYEPAADIPPGFEPFHVLGYHGDTRYYLVNTTRQIVGLTVAQHTLTNLINLAPLPYWESRAPSRSTGDFKVAMAVDALFRAAESAGGFNPDNHRRGIGVWQHSPGFVVNYGDGARYLHEAKQSLKPVYEQSEPWAIDIDAEGARNADGAAIRDMCCLLPFSNPVHGKLLAGWLYGALIAGALNWRPHLWLTGDTGAGKSTVIGLARQFLHSICINLDARTTEPMLRREIGYSALPVVWDEFEAIGRASKASMEPIFEYIRTSSVGGTIGRADQQNPRKTIRFRAQSMFLMSSINDAIAKVQDETRFTLLDLETPPPKDARRRAEYDARYADFLNRQRQLVTPDMRSALLARATTNLPVILHNIGAFTDAFKIISGVPRFGQQMGALVALSYGLLSTAPVSTETATQIISGTDWTGLFPDTSASTSENGCLTHLASHTIRVDADHHRTVERSVGELVRIARDGSIKDGVSSASATASLGRIGLRQDIRRSGTPDTLAIFYHHPAITRLFADTEWTNIGRVLLRIPGAHKKQVRVPIDGNAQQCVVIPTAMLAGSDIQQEELP